jgi:hypothetical protein
VGRQKVVLVDSDTENVGIAEYEDSGSFGILQLNLRSAKTERIDPYFTSVGPAEEALRLRRRSVEPSLGLVIDPQAEISRYAGAPDGWEMKSQEASRGLYEKKQAKQND